MQQEGLLAADAIGAHMAVALSLQESSRPQQAYVAFLDCVREISTFLCMRPCDPSVSRLFGFSSMCLSQAQKLHPQVAAIQQQLTLSSPLTPSGSSLRGMERPPPSGSPLSAPPPSASAVPRPPLGSTPPIMSPAAQGGWHVVSPSEASSAAQAQAAAKKSRGSFLRKVVGFFTSIASSGRLKAHGKRFKSLDRDSDGTLSRMEFAMGLEYFGINKFSDVLYVALFGEACVPVGPFRKSTELLFGGSPLERQELSYRIFDPDGKGFVTQGDFCNVLKLLYQIVEVITCSPLFDSVDPRRNNELLNRFVFGVWHFLSKKEGKMRKDEFVRALLSHAVALNALGLRRGSVSVWPLPRFVNRMGEPACFGDAKFRLVLQMMAGISTALDHDWSARTAMSSVDGASAEGVEATAAATARPKHSWLSERDFTLKLEFKLRDVPWGKLKGEVLCIPFVCHCPQVFRCIREISGVEEAIFRNSFGIEQILGSLVFRGELTTLTSSVSEGKSGSFFFTTVDGMFLAKTISKGELRTLLLFLPEYFARLRDDPSSLLCRFFGVYELGGRPFIILKNVFTTMNKMDVVYDLKGSTKGRSNKRGKGPKKDNDLRKEGKLIMIPRAVRTSLLTSIQRDVDLLRKFKILDYSLLIGMHRITPASNVASSNAWMTNDGGFFSVDRSLLYYVGIIDHLICFDAKKKAEALVKSIFYRADTVSAVEPELYARRFRDFLEGIMISPVAPT